MDERIDRLLARCPHLAAIQDSVQAQKATPGLLNFIPNLANCPVAEMMQEKLLGPHYFFLYLCEVARCLSLCVFSIYKVCTWTTG
eukprot:1160428-Pelagomonas_calceolata.AAC.2